MSCYSSHTRFLYLLLICLISQGCGVKLFYNNADRVARWWVSDYISMDKAQRSYFSESSAALMYWHRTTQLSIYRDELLTLANTIESQELDADQLEKTVAEVERWGIAMNARAVPIGVDVLLSLSPKQLQAFDKNFLKSNREYEREAKRDPDDYAQREAKDYAKFLRRFIGRLSDEQETLILDKHLEMLPDAQVILDYRLYWQRKLLTALQSEPPDAELVKDLMLNFDEHYTPEFAHMIDVNEVIYQELTLELLTSLTDSQRAKLVSETLGYAEIFDELIAEAAPNAPPAPNPLPRYIARP